MRDLRESNEVAKEMGNLGGYELQVCVGMYACARARARVCVRAFVVCTSWGKVCPNACARMNALLHIHTRTN